MVVDLIAMYQLPHVPKAVCWVHRRGASIPMLAISDEVNPSISIYDGRGENPKPVHVLNSIHRRIVHIMAYNDKHDCVVSADEGGMLEYWRPNGTFEKPADVFEFKSSTNLFDFKKAKAVPVSITMSPTGEQFATFSEPDRQIRLFHFSSGKLYRSYDESIVTLNTIQQAADESAKMDSIQFGKKLAIEKDIDNKTSPSSESGALSNAVNVSFDESGNFILYGSLSGIKVVNTVTNRRVRVIGGDETIRATNIAVYQGAPKRKDVFTVEMAASSNPLLEEAQERDPMIVCTAWNSHRFYLFTNETEYEPFQRSESIANFVAASPKAIVMFITRSQQMRPVLLPRRQRRRRHPSPA